MLDSVAMHCARLIAPLLLCLTSCASVDFERTTQTSGTFVSVGPGAGAGARRGGAEDPGGQRARSLLAPSRGGGGGGRKRKSAAAAKVPDFFSPVDRSLADTAGGRGVADLRKCH